LPSTELGDQLGLLARPRRQSAGAGRFSSRRRPLVGVGCSNFSSAGIGDHRTTAVIADETERNPRYARPVGTVTAGELSGVQVLDMPDGRI